MSPDPRSDLVRGTRDSVVDDTTPEHRRAGGARVSTWLPRNLHPVAWWLWAIGLVVAASRTSNPWLLGLILVVAGFVVHRRRSNAPWARAYRFYLIFGAFIVVARVFTRVLFGAATDTGSQVLFRLPSVPLPDWMAGITVGGPVELQAVVVAALQGLRLATIIACIGAANALANPKRALRVLPGALYELGVAVVISITVAPQLVTGVQRVRRARRLRGASARGLRAVRGIALPVLHDALDRSIALAAAMDSRGYGRRAALGDAQRRTTVVCLLGGLAALCLGAYGLLGGGTSIAFAVPVVIVGVALCVAGMALGSARVRHSDYLPDPWDVPESLVAAAGLVAALVFVIGGHYGLGDLHPSLAPLSWPGVPLVPALAVLVAATPACTAPPPPRPVLSQHRVRVRADAGPVAA